LVNQKFAHPYGTVAGAVAWVTTRHKPLQTTGKYSLTSLSSRVYSQQVFLEKLCCSCAGNVGKVTSHDERAF
jgi:hypothetical protein